MLQRKKVDILCVQETKCKVSGVMCDKRVSAKCQHR